MKVYYHKIDSGNVGDDINEVMWRKLLPTLDELSCAEWLIGAGTILDGRLKALNGRKVVMGSGFRPGAKCVHLPDDIRFAAVRGLLSAQACGLAAQVAACDPGFLVNTVWPQRASRTTRVGFIPHVYSERHSSICAAAADAGLTVISPTLSPEIFLRELAQCARVYTESLHGAIFADALRVPWARVRICSSYYEGNGVADFKWADTFSVLGLPSAPINRMALIPFKRSWSFAHEYLRPLQAAAERRLVGALVRRRDDAAVFQLSERARLDERVDTLLDRVNSLRTINDSYHWPAAKRGTTDGYQVGTAEPSLRVLAFPKCNENPYLGNFARSLERCGAHVDEFDFGRACFRRYDVVHMHWPDTHLRTHSWWRAIGKHARLLLTCIFLRARGTRIVWMMHNLKPHEKDHWISRALFPLWFPRLCTHVMALTSTGLTSARTMYGALAHKAALVVPHGHYRDVYAARRSRADARKELGVPADRFTFLFFGNIRRYKNVPLLIETFRRLRAQDVQLIVAGRPVLGMRADDLLALAENDDRIHLHLEFIPDEQVPAYIAAADKVVLPFDSVLNSGSVMLCLSLNRSVLAPRLGALPEIQAQVGSRWLHLYDGELTVQLLEQSRSDLERPREDETPDLSAFDWDAIGRSTYDFYRSRGEDFSRTHTESSPALGQSSIP